MSQQARGKELFRQESVKIRQVIRMGRSLGSKNRSKGNTRAGGGYPGMPLPPDKWGFRDYKPSESCTLKDEELAMAKKAFFDVDQDGSGSIDREELTLMLRGLGQNPSDEEINAMMKGADVGDKDGAGSGDGKIDLREFLVWFAKGLKQTRNMTREDVLDAFYALGGDKQKGIEKAKLQKMLSEEYDLDVNVSESFSTLGNRDELTLQEFESMLLNKGGSGNSVLMAA